MMPLSRNQQMNIMRVMKLELKLVSFTCLCISKSLLNFFISYFVLVESFELFKLLFHKFRFN